MRTRRHLLLLVAVALVPAACCSQGVDRRDSVGSFEFSTRALATRTSDDAKATAEAPHRIARALRREVEEYPASLASTRRLYCGE